MDICFTKEKIFVVNACPLHEGMELESLYEDIYIINKY
jgi:hypothetical protein